MAKMTSVILLCSLTTVRDKERVTFDPAPKGQNPTAVPITEDELATLNKMTATTGRPHYRLPVNEDGKAATGSDVTETKTPTPAELLVDQGVKKIETAVAKEEDHALLKAALAAENAKGEDKRKGAVDALEARIEELDESGDNGEGGEGGGDENAGL